MWIPLHREIEIDFVLCLYLRMSPHTTPSDTGNRQTDPLCCFLMQGTNQSLAEKDVGLILHILPHPSYEPPAVVGLGAQLATSRDRVSITGPPQTFWPA